MIKELEINKTHIIALTPSMSDLNQDHDFVRLSNELSDSMHPWLHLTIAQYTNPAITPTVCYHLKQLTSLSSPITVHIEKLDFWRNNGVLFLKVRKEKEILSIYHRIRSIFWRFLPDQVLKKWYIPSLFWIPHISLAYNMDESDAMRIVRLLNNLHFTFVIEKIVLKDSDTKYKEYQFNATP